MDYFLSHQLRNPGMVRCPCKYPRNLWFQPWFQFVVLLWMDEILHHPRNPRMMIRPCKSQGTMVSTMASKWCRILSIHSRAEGRKNWPPENGGAPVWLALDSWSVGVCKSKHSPVLSVDTRLFLQGKPLENRLNYLGHTSGEGSAE